MLVPVARMLAHSPDDRYQTGSGCFISSSPRKIPASGAWWPRGCWRPGFPPIRPKACPSFRRHAGPRGRSWRSFLQPSRWGRHGQVPCWLTLQPSPSSSAKRPTFDQRVPVHLECWSGRGRHLGSCPDAGALLRAGASRRPSDTSRCRGTGHEIVSAAPSAAHDGRGPLPGGRWRSDRTGPGGSSKARPRGLGPAGRRRALPLLLAVLWFPVRLLPLPSASPHGPRPGPRSRGPLRVAVSARSGQKGRPGRRYGHADRLQNLWWVPRPPPCWPCGRLGQADLDPDGALHRGPGEGGARCVPATPSEDQLMAVGLWYPAHFAGQPPVSSGSS